MEVLTSTVISSIEIHPHTNKRYAEKNIPKDMWNDLDEDERKRIESKLDFYNGDRLQVYPSPFNSSSIRIELNSATTDLSTKYRLTALDLSPDGHLKEIHRLEHNDIKRFQKKNNEIESRNLYYIVKV